MLVAGVLGTELSGKEGKIQGNSCVRGGKGGFLSPWLEKRDCSLVILTRPGWMGLAASCSSGRLELDEL